MSVQRQQQKLFNQIMRYFFPLPSVPLEVPSLLLLLLLVINIGAQLAMNLRLPSLYLRRI